MSTNTLDNAHTIYKYNKPHVFYSPSSCIVSLFILLIFSFSVTDLAYIVPQATAYADTTSNSLNVLNTALHDSNQNLIGQNATKIIFEKSGGFAGISSSITVDIHSLPSDEAHKIQGMIDNSSFFDLPSKSIPPQKGAADYFKYKVTVETEEGKKYTIETNDITMPSELRPLVNCLNKLLSQKQ